MVQHKNKSSEPLVSIIITSYNRANFISKSIDSALAQDYKNLEIIISDNNSTDDTDKVIQKYQNDPRVKYFKNSTNLGMIQNFIIATEERAKGKYITYVSSDDFLINNHFISQGIEIINKHDNVLLVFGIVVTLEKNIMKEDNKTLHLYANEFQEGRKVFLDFANNKTLGWGAALINRKELMDLNIFGSKASSVDYEANLLLMLKGNVGFINHNTYVFQLHDNQFSKNHLKTMESVLQNYTYIFETYKYANQHNCLSHSQLEAWKNDLLFLEARYVTLRFLAINKNEYNRLMNYYKTNHLLVYRRLKTNIKHCFLSFFYRRPIFSLKILQLISKSHHRNLKNILPGNE